MNKNEIKKKILDEKIIAIIRGVKQDEILRVVEALVKGGIKLLEFTFDHTNESFIQDTVTKINICKRHFDDAVMIGAGTVLSSIEVEKAVEAGAEFIISPNVDTKVIRRTIALNKVSIPGALTPTEAVIAYEAGADFVKLFPAGELGKGYIKALTSPLKHIPFIAVGGISTENIQDFLDIGICGVGIGGNLIIKKAIDERRYDEIRKVAQAFVNKIKT